MEFIKKLKQKILSFIMSKNLNKFQTYKKILKYKKAIFIKIFLFAGFFLLIMNLMWLFYAYIWVGIANIYDFFHDNRKYYYNLSDIEYKFWVNFKSSIDDFIFLKDCSLWSDDAYGRFLVINNKICVIEFEPTVINHEIVHYSLRNLSMTEKMKLRPYIDEQIFDIESVIKELKVENLKWDDEYFYRLLENIYELASEKEYGFYDNIKTFVITYRWNEEFITYAIWNLVMDDSRNRLYFMNFKLDNPRLIKIYNNYKYIYSFVLKSD